MPRKNSRKTFLKKLLDRRELMAAVVVLVLIGLSAIGWAFKHHSQKPLTPSTNNPSSSAKPYVNLSPPTAQDKQDVADHKKDLSQTPTSTPTADGKRSVAPIITDADKNVIHSYVSGVFEDGGTCTATITNPSTAQVITKASQGFADASHTTCAPMDNLGLSSGSWQLVLSYSSSSAEGNSSTYSIKVP